jgi:hypothetical protein
MIGLVWVPPLEGDKGGGHNDIKSFQFITFEK